MSNFQQILLTLTVSELKTRLPLLSKTLKPTRKDHIIEYVYNDCKQYHKTYWQQLDVLEKKVIAEMLYQDNSSVENELFNIYRFKAKYGELPEHFIRRNSWGSHASTPSKKSYLTVFIFNGKLPDEYRQWMSAYVEKPQAALIPTIDEQKLPTFIEYEPDQYEKKYGAQSNPKIKRLHTEEMVSRDLESLLRFIESGQCTVSDKTQRPTAVSMRKLDAILLGGDYYQADDEWDVRKWSGSPIRPIRSFAWPLIVQSGGLAKRVGKKLQLSNAGKKALNAPLHKTVKTLYQRWRNKGLLDEFSRIDTIKGQASKGRVMTAVSPRRKAIEAILQQCPLNGGWTGIDSLFQYIKSTDSELQISHNEWKLYINDSQYGALGYSSAHEFEILEGRYILVYLFEYLATLGLIDIAYTIPYNIRDDYSDLWGVDDLFHLSRYDGLLYFRINPLGAYCLEMSDDYQPMVIEKSALLNVDAALHIHLLRNADPAEIMMLERYTKVLSANEWQLSTDSLLAAMKNNFSADKFLPFLLENSTQDKLNELLSDFFNAAAERENALKDFGAARLLHCHSKPFANMLANAKETKKYCIYAGERVLVIPEKTKTKFIQGLHKLGYVYPQEKS